MKYEIVSAQLTPQYLTMTTTTGKLLNIPQGREDLPRLVELCQQYLPKGETFFVTEEEISGTTSVVVKANIVGPLKEIEKVTGGAVKFFRMARKVAARIFGLSNQKDGTFIRLDDATPAMTGSDENGQPISMDAEQKIRIQEVMSQAVPVTKEDEEEGIAVSHETVVAVTDEGAMIGVEALEASLNCPTGPVGVGALIARLAKLKYEHTAQDVLSFLKRGDLPLTVNGDIIAYRRMKSTSTGGVFTDSYSGTVDQCVGDRVRIPVEHVDKNRRQDCSTGLHIARRGYLSGFHGDVIMICLVKPEDVIVVPHNTPNKVRVSEYLNVLKVSDSAYSQLTANRSLDPVVHAYELRVINDLINGWIPDTKRIVTVTGKTKDKVIYKDVGSTVTRQTTVNPVSQTPASPLDTDKVFNVEDLKEKSTKSRSHAPVVPSAVVGKTKKTAAKKTVPIKGKLVEPAVGKVLTPRQRLDKLRPFKTVKAADEATRIKKAAKKSWEALGVSEAEVEVIKALCK